MQMKRHFLISVGILSFLLGSAGVLLPVLPTTPFLLLSGYCFAHSSNKFNDWLKKTKIYQKNFTAKSALLIGTEHSGLSDFWKDKGENVLIPMSGTIDSLNLSNAAAITCYEILRQKLEK